MQELKAPVLNKESIRTPPPWVQRIYLSLVDRFSSQGETRRWISVKQLPEMLSISAGMARQFVHKGTKAHLVVRVYEGTYVLVRPSIALRLGALPEYWAELIAVNDALEQSAYSDWAFACLTASQRTDYVPKRPWLVTHPEHSPLTDTRWRLFDTVDRFAYAHSPSEEVRVSFLEWEVNVPLLTPEETSLILASTRLPREVEAAKELLTQADIDVDASILRKLNFFHIQISDDVEGWTDPEIRVPSFIEERQKRLGQQILKTRED